MRTSGENTAMRGRDFLSRGLAAGALSMALVWPCGAASISTGSARQRQQSNRRGVNFVVTPQLLLNGQDYRRGAFFDLLRE